jgi:hypothetical protein
MYIGEEATIISVVVNAVMGNVNRKPTEGEMAHAMKVIRDAFPDYEPVFGGHSSYGGHRAPRDHTVSFRLRDQWGKYHSNVIWVLPERLGSLTIANVRAMVARRNGKSGRKKRK